MFCGNCGTENLSSAKFCKNCGQAINVNLSTKTSQSKQLVQTKKIIFVVLAIVIVLLVVLGSLGMTRNTINLDKYVKIEATGYDGDGSVTATIDWDAIEKRYGKKIKFTKIAEVEYGGKIDGILPMDALKESVSITIQQKKNLSNGEHVSYLWNVEKEATKYLNCRLKYEDKDFEVSGLQTMPASNTLSEKSDDGTEKVQTDGATPKDAEYVLPDSNKRLLTEEDLDGLSAEKCRIARNEIYARHGRKFQDKELQKYFDSCEWYEGTIEPDEFNESDLSEIEIKNEDLIVQFEKAKGYR